MPSSRKKIRILLVVGTMDRGGVEMMLMNILRHIDRSRFELIFLCFEEKKYDFEDEIISLGSKIVRTPDVKRVGVFRYVSNLRGVISKEGIDIVHAHTYFNSMFAMIAATMAGVKVRITHSHNTKSEEGMSLAKKVYAFFAKLVVNLLSTSYFACGNDAGRAMFYKRNNFIVINNGISVDDFAFSKDRRKTLRKSLGIASGDIVIMNVGRFEIQKNHTFLIDIYAEYLKLNASSSLVLVGEGSLRAEIEDKARKLGLLGHVKFLGKRSDVESIYNIADVLLLPSLHEGLPVTLVEAQANGLRCVVSDEVDKEAGFTGCVSFVSLSDSASDWASLIYRGSSERLDTSDMRNGKYDIDGQVLIIENLYSDLLVGVK